MVTGLLMRVRGRMAVVRREYDLRVMLFQVGSGLFGGIRRRLILASTLCHLQRRGVPGGRRRMGRGSHGRC